MKKHTCFFCGRSKPKGKSLPMIGPDGTLIYGCSFHPGVKRENEALRAAEAAE